MRIEWLYEAKLEYRDLLLYHKNTVGTQSAEKFAKMILSSVRKLETFPQLGVLKETQLLGRYGFRALFIGKYVCIYRIVEDSVLIYHIADARTNYMYHIFGIKGEHNNLISTGKHSAAAGCFFSCGR